ncbi:hypothetical protein [Candidatus Nitronereus thalassa]|uniref:Transposase n=1 Tax=Candidatus Nitronereus thalassa TaxID=3020898 RepID=A0ABU3K483_9BACT|nr:hypothetical protein [Candidatus Nitronereus thalassa]MDT7041200.1 hypothetical protein [Candidatus Nitronereus thalassa]
MNVALRPPHSHRLKTVVCDAADDLWHVGVYQPGRIHDRSRLSVRRARMRRAQGAASMVMAVLRFGLSPST